MSRGARTCPECGSWDTKVYDVKNNGPKTTRRHLCRDVGCGARFVTVQEHARLVRGWVRKSQL